MRRKRKGEAKAASLRHAVSGFAAAARAAARFRLPDCKNTALSEFVDIAAILRRSLIDRNDE